MSGKYQIKWYCRIERVPRDGFLISSLGAGLPEGKGITPLEAQQNLVKELARRSADWSEMSNAFIDSGTS